MIEARPSGVNKGGAARRVIAEYGEPDFVLCVGDDKTGKLVERWEGREKEKGDFFSHYFSR